VVLPLLPGPLLQVCKTERKSLQPLPDLLDLPKPNLVSWRLSATLAYETVMFHTVMTKASSRLAWLPFFQLFSRG
jgi:hypothetical protein